MEQLFVWLLVKPGVDAYRVASKSETEAGVALNTRTEMTGIRMMELVAESIPGSVIQAMAFFAVNGDRSMIPLLSLSSSVVFSAFISAQMSYEWDASDEKRKAEPEFYGYLPTRLTARCFALLQLFFLAAFNLLLRSISFVVLAQMSTSTVMVVFGGEFAFFLLYKIATDDFMHWLPVYGMPGVVLSFVARLIMKVAVDWVACVQFRNPTEVGGLYWSLTIFATCAIAICSALAHGDSGITLIVVSACAGQLVAFALFLFTINLDYLATFYDTRTSSRYNIDFYFGAEGDDECRFSIFSNHERIWLPIKDDIKTWLDESLPRWLEESPPWFNDNKRSLIPEWLVEDKTLLSRVQSEP